MLRLHIAVALSFALTACHTFPDPPAKWEGDFTPEAVLDKVGQKLGFDPEKDASAEDFVGAVSIVRRAGEKPVEMGYAVRWKQPDRWSLEKTIANQRVKRISDGTTTVEVSDGKVTKRGLPLGEDGVDLFFRHLYAVRYFRDGAGGPPKIDEVFQLKEGGEAIRIGRFAPDGSRLILSIDAATLLPIAMREMVEVDGGKPETMETFFADFAPDSRGILVPRTLRSYAAGTLMQEMKVKDARWNTGLTDAEFAIPRS